MKDIVQMLTFRNERDPWGYYKIQNALGVFAWVCIAYAILSLIELYLIILG